MSNIIHLTAYRQQMSVQDSNRKGVSKASGKKNHASSDGAVIQIKHTNGHPDTVKISGKRTNADKASTPIKTYQDAAMLLEDTKERLYEEASMQSQSPENIHNLKPGDLLDLLA